MLAKASWILIGMVLGACWAFSLPLHENLHYGTFVSNAYDGRSVFINPAALGFQTELNGLGLLSSFGYGGNDNLPDEYSFAASIGYFGIGSEKIEAETGGNYSRYSIALGVPIHPLWYLGSRYRFTRSDFASLDHLNSLDLGIQFRPTPRLSFGLLANTLNQPTVNGVLVPTLMTFGTTVRPWKYLEVAADFETPSSNFFKHWDYQAGAGIQALEGLWIRAGYHSRHKFQAGIQLNLTIASLNTVAQPSSNRRLGTTFSLASRPYPSFIKPEVVLKTETQSTLSEESTRGNWFSKGQTSLAEFLKLLKGAEEDRAVSTVLLNIPGFPLGLSAAQDVHEALLSLRERGKKVIVFLGNAGTKEYLIAAAATQIHMEKGGELRLMGLRSERYFLKGTLDKIGIEGQFLAKGQYKSAPEMFTQKESSAAEKEQTLDRLQKAEQIIVQLLQKSRGIHQDKWDEIIRSALYGPEQALKAGLVDSLEGYSKVVEKTRRAGASIRDELAVQRDSLGLPHRITVVAAQGDILRRRIPFAAFWGHREITTERMEKKIQQAAADPLTKAIVIRVSSPGGEILPSYEIASAIQTAGGKKPVIVSMGDVAASGGYLISAPANRIFAQPLTVTGSIGVFLGKFNLGKLYEKIDLRKEILSRSPHPGLFSEDRPWNTDEKAIWLTRLNQYYDSFVEDIAKWRKLDKAVVDKFAQGRVWLGGDAMNGKLVDELGGYRASIQYAAKQAGLEVPDYDLFQISESAGLFDLFGEDGWLAKSAETSTFQLPFIKETAGPMLWLSQLGEQPILYWAPIGKME
ncbi:MAG: signal peptide peptidase SppA [Deltaproteobacteria bacterium]|nr:signal peptide peptidase SppA [Deltaproteobacteria bacterium]